MVNRMADLRRKVASRLRENLHGKEFDMMDGVRPRLPHMIGVTQVGEIHDPTNEDDTLLDPSHQFWQEYEADIRTKNRLKRKIETAIRSLREEGILEITYPYGEEADIIYVEVEELPPVSVAGGLDTICRKCGAPVEAQENLNERDGHYFIQYSINCNECSFSGVFEKGLIRR